MVDSNCLPVLQSKQHMCMVLINENDFQLVVGQ